MSLFGLGIAAAASGKALRGMVSSIHPKVAKSLETIGPVWTKLLPFWGPGESAVRVGSILKQGIQQSKARKEITSRLGKSFYKRNDLYNQGLKNVLYNVGVGAGRDWPELKTLSEKVMKHGNMLITSFLKVRTRT